MDNERMNELERDNADLRAQLADLKRARRFGLTFEYKPDKAVSRITDGVPYLSPQPGSIPAHDGLPTHRLIKGDNYPALVALLPELEGTVNVIYIDPPYNTGNKDFIYNDRFVDSTDTYRHSTWLSFMKPRLILARRMLSDDGVIFVSIDDHEQAHLRILMDEVFGEGNFVSNVIWDGGLKNNSRFVSNGHDYMMIYAKSVDYLVHNDTRWKEEKKGLQLLKGFVLELQSSDSPLDQKQKELRAWLKSHKNDLDKGLQAYQFIDEDGVFTRGDISAPGGNGARYEVLHPVTQKPVNVPAGGWRYSEKSMQEKIANGEISFGKDETTSPRFKRKLSDDGENDTQVVRSYFWEERANANRDLQKIMGSGAFGFPKDVNVLKRWIDLVANPSALVLDFFAGSGTTLQAVAELNAADNGNRRCVLITDAGKPEETGTDIADDITYERCRRVLTGQDWADGKDHPDLGQGLDRFEVEFVETSEVPYVEDESEPEPEPLTESDLRFRLEDALGDGDKADAALRAWRSVARG